MSDMWREVWPQAMDAVSRARMAYLSDLEAVRLPVAGVGSAERPTAGNLVPFEGTSAEASLAAALEAGGFVSKFMCGVPDFSGVADAVWVDQTDDYCPMCSNPCISDPEAT